MSQNRIKIIQAVCDTGPVASRSEAKRLINIGAIALDDVVVDDPMAVLPEDGSVEIRVGKRKFLVTLDSGTISHSAEVTTSGDYAV